MKRYFIKLLPGWGLLVCLLCLMVWQLPSYTLGRLFHLGAFSLAGLLTILFQF